MGVTVQAKPKKKRTKKKKTKDESIEVKVVTNEEYQFQHKLTQWSRMNLAKPLLRILDERSLLEPTTVQASTIPKGLNTKKNILAAAETGSGKESRVQYIVHRGSKLAVLEFR